MTKLKYGDKFYYNFAIFISIKIRLTFTDFFQPNRRNDSYKPSVASSDP